MQAIMLDIETVPDVSPEVWAAMEFKAPSNYKDPEKIAAYIEEAKRKELERAALNPLTGRAVLVTITTDKVDVDDFPIQLCAPDPAKDEAAMLKDAFEALSLIDKGHRLVTFNGRDFDLPYLVTRAMAHGIASPWRLPRSHEYTMHLDMYQELGKPGGLDLVSRAILGRGKSTGIEGRDVPGMWLAGRHDEVRGYALDEMGLLCDLYARWKTVNQGG
jgi:DNA polymerase elongation subunit (family B)